MIEVFDDLFFRGALRGRVICIWADVTANGSGSNSRAKLIAKEEGGSHVVIELAKPSDDCWTDATVQNILTATIEKMVFAHFLLHACMCPRCKKAIAKAMMSETYVGPDPSVVKLLNSVEQTANKFLAGFKKFWQLL